ncbi:3783_t:CDS:1, partial [Gigaspora margarita]
NYIQSRDIRYQKKLFITQQVYDQAIHVILNPKTSCGTAQDRYWMRSTFTIKNIGTEEDPNYYLYHKDKPVAVKEKLYDILCSTHRTQQHGGQQKLWNELRNQYSFIRQDLVEKFVTQ